MVALGVAPTTSPHSRLLRLALPNPHPPPPPHTHTSAISPSVPHIGRLHPHSARSHLVVAATTRAACRCSCSCERARLHVVDHRHHLLLRHRIQSGELLGQLRHLRDVHDTRAGGDKSDPCLAFGHTLKEKAAPQLPSASLASQPHCARIEQLSALVGVPWWCASRHPPSAGCSPGPCQCKLPRRGRPPWGERRGYGWGERTHL